MGGHVFVSYSRADEPYVQSLAAACAEHGIECWTDSAIDYGSRWPQVIKERVDSSAVFVVVMTPDAEESVWVGREIDQAESTARPILPLLLRGLRFFRLAEHQHEDVRSGDLPSERWFSRVRQLSESHAAAPSGERRGAELRVDGFGRGDFVTIAEAVAAAAPGARIVVAPGLYREAFTIEKPLELEGDGEVVVEARAPLVVTAKACRLRGLTLRRQVVLARGRHRRGPKRCVVVQGGQLELVECDVSSDPPGFASCISVREDGSVRLYRNRIHHGAIGIVFGAGAGGLVEDNQILESDSGVWIGHAGANPTLRKNSIYDNATDGVEVWKDGRPTLEENEIFRNGMTGVRIRDGAAPILRSNRIYDNPVGVEIAEGASGTLDLNDLHANETPVALPEEAGHWVERLTNNTT